MRGIARDQADCCNPRAKPLEMNLVGCGHACACGEIRNRINLTVVFENTENIAFAAARKRVFTRTADKRVYTCAAVKRVVAFKAQNGRSVLSAVMIVGILRTNNYLNIGRSPLRVVRCTNAQFAFIHVRGGLDHRPAPYSEPYPCPHSATSVTVSPSSTAT